MTLSSNISRSNNNNGSKKISQKTKAFLEKAERRISGAFFDPIMSRDYQAPEWENRISYRDGIDHINISMSSVSDLGQGLSLDYNLAWDHPSFGRFLSITSFWMFVAQPEINDRLRSIRSRDLHQIAGGGIGYSFPNSRLILVDAIYQRIRSLPGLVELIVESRLPFECYNPAREGRAARRPEYAEWLIPAMEIIRNALKAGMGADLSSFSDGTDYKESFGKLFNRPRLGGTRKSGTELTNFLLKGTVKKDEPKPKQAKKAPAPKPPKAEKPKAPEAPVDTNDLGASNWRKVAANYLESMEDAEIKAVLVFAEHKEAVAFMMRATAALLTSETSADVDQGPGRIVGTDRTDDLPANSTSVMVLAGKDGVNFMRLGAFHNPFIYESYNTVMEIKGDDRTDQQVAEEAGFPWVLVQAAGTYAKEAKERRARKADGKKGEQVYDRKDLTELIDGVPTTVETPVGPVEVPPGHNLEIRTTDSNGNEETSVIEPACAK